VPHFDLPLEELREYRSATVAPKDLDAYWEEAIREARDRATAATFEPYKPEAYGPLEVFDVTFSGAAGHPVRAWFLRPRAATAPVPCRVTFIGYGGGRGLPAEHTLYAAAGFAELVVDTRAQGGVGSAGATGDPGAGESGPEAAGVMTRGILDPRTYYYRRLYVDAVRAVETAAGDAHVDSNRIGVSGFSQGGGLSLASAALVPSMVRLCQADMPYLADIEHAITLTSERPYTELVDYLAQHHDQVATVLRTVSYVDNAVLAPRITARSSVSVGLMDEICPPSTVFAAYNAIGAPKDIAVYPYSGHRLPGHHIERQLEEFAREMS
jgi:cephalosporin-C deacetylase